MRISDANGKLKPWAKAFATLLIYLFGGKR